MEISTGRISVAKTARYFILGDQNVPITEIVFVLHGYGMKADDFLQNFSMLNEPGRLIIAPEGLSRFYRKAFTGDVVASWMTKEERIHEIEDYVNYLEQLYAKVVTTSSVKKIVLGFSQGATTASRWIMNGKNEIDEFVIWCGEFANDFNSIPDKMPNLWHVIAEKDEFIAMERFKKQSDYIYSLGFEVQEFSFDGGHVIDQNTLKQVWNHMNQ